MKGMKGALRALPTKDVAALACEHSPGKHPPESHPDRRVVSSEASLPVMRSDLEIVFRGEYGHVLAVARRVLGSSAEADDVAQDVFLSFARSQVPTSEARAWLTVAAAHTALNALRSQRRRGDRERRVAEREIAIDPAEAAVLSTERQRVREALRRLSRQQAIVLVLRHSGLGYAEIAAATSLSAGSVGTTLRRAETALRKELRDESSD